MLGSCPRDQDGKATEARCDFRWRGGTLMISRRIRPSRTAANFAAMMSWYQLAAKSVRGLSSWKQCCAKLAKSVRSSAEYSLALYVSAVVIRHSAGGVWPVSFASRPSGLPSSSPRRAAHGQPPHMLRRSVAISCCTTSLSVGVNGDFAVAVGSAFFSISRSISISIFLAQLGRGRFVDKPGDHRLALGDLPAFAVLGDGHLLVECGGEQCRQVFRRPSARVAGLALLEARVP